MAKLPPIGTVLLAGDVGVVESYGAFMSGDYKVARIRVFRTGDLVLAAGRKIEDGRWEKLT